MTRGVQELLDQLRNDVLGEDMDDDCKRRAEISGKGPHILARGQRKLHGPWT